MQQEEQSAMSSPPVSPQQMNKSLRRSGRTTPRAVTGALQHYWHTALFQTEVMAFLWPAFENTTAQNLRERLRAAGTVPAVAHRSVHTRANTANGVGVAVEDTARQILSVASLRQQEAEHVIAQTGDSRRGKCCPLALAVNLCSCQ